ncbi:hypothetical protein CRUP_019006, partial [Coryphaenoides rupestris]
GGMWYGVDINNEDIADNYLAFVWEPSIVRINALTAASEAACLILSVDETIKNPRTPMALAGPRLQYPEAPARCLSWEQWEEESWMDGVTLSITLEGGYLVKADFSDPKFTCAMKEFTPESTMAPPAAQEGKGKRKRGRPSAKEEEEEGEEQEKKEGGEEENVCPNGRLGKKTTPVRKVRGHGRAGQRLFKEDPGKATAAAADRPVEVKGIVGKTPPHGVARPRGRPAKTPTQNAPLVRPSGRWGQTMCPIDAQTAILIGGQGARMQFCKDPMWKLCT